MKSASERGKEFRAKRKALGLPAVRGERTSKGKRKSKFKKGEFIAIDGEGENYGEEESVKNADDSKVYKSVAHKYTLLAASTGDELFDNGNRLSCRACLDFLLDLSDKHKRAIFVIFSGGYDFNHILMHDIPRDFLARIAKGEIVDVDLGGQEYRIEYRQRKSLTIRRGKKWSVKKVFDRKTGKKVDKHVLSWESKITVWDVFGFFQDNFVNVIKKWLGAGHPDFPLIEKMKALRGKFNEVDTNEIRKYNDAELRVLVQLMEKVRDAIDGLGLSCARWDGAGAVAAAIFAKEGIKDFKRETPHFMELAVRTAYAGGRIEACKIGATEKPVHHYDINSAYPAVMKDLPCLQCGEWHYVTHPDNVRGPFSLVHVRFHFVDGLPFYPLFFRNDDNSIVYPAQGEGWYWFPEYQNSLDYQGTVEVLEYFYYEVKCTHKPFCWIPGYYETRQNWIEKPSEDWHGGGEKVIKLGLNSLYGKTAQQLGGIPGKPPAYWQMEWAGFITSSTRAALCKAAMQFPHSVISFATDGLFCERPLDLPCPAKKTLGMWEYKVHTGMVIIMPGVYWLIDGEHLTHYSRGFDKDTMKTPDLVLAAWRRGETSVPVKTRRLVGVGTACTSDMFWGMRGRFIESERDLNIDLWNSDKRMTIDVSRETPHSRLVATEVEHNYFADTISAPYPIKWLDGAESPGYVLEKEVDKEVIDTYNV